MKKVFLIAVLAFATISANAQFFSGLAFDIKWQNEGVKPIGGISTQTSSSYGGEISPQLGYKFNDDWLVGARINFIFDKSYLTQLNQDAKTTENYISSSIGWDIAPFGRYRIAKFGKDDWFSIWADVHAYYGELYPKNVEETGYTYLDFNKKFIYGIQAMPAVGFRFNERTTLFVNVALLSLGYSGSCTRYKEGDVYENRAILFTGKMSGLFSALALEGMYGIKFGLVKTIKQNK